MLKRLCLGVCLVIPGILSGCNEGAGGAHVTGVTPNEKGIYETNPFTPDTEPPFPALEVAERVFEFDRMPAGEERSHAFTVKNIGEVDVRLALGPQTCQCTVGALNDEVLKPGEETDVVLTWTPVDITPEFNKGATVWTDVPEMQRIDFSVRGKVVPQVGIVPGDNWVAGLIQDDLSTPLTGIIYSLLDPNFEIVDIEISDDWLKLTTHDAEESTLQPLMGLKGYHLICEVLPTCPLGEFRGTITFHTNMEQEQYKTMVVTVSGSRTGPFEIQGTGWSGTTYGMLDMGEIVNGTEHSTVLSLVAQPMEEPLELTLIEANPPFLGFEMRRDEAYPNTNRERYYLTFTVPADAPFGDWVGEGAGTVRLRTNIPDREEMSIRVELRVRGAE
jgi:hypothetical protein